MTVKAATGLKVPMESQPRKYITDATAVEVPRSAYYVRAVARGDLAVVTAASATAAKE